MTTSLRKRALRVAQRLGHLGVASVRGLLRLMPIDRAAALSGWIWRVVTPLLKARHRRVVAHMRRAYPDLSDRDLDRMARDMWETLGRIMAEGFMIDRLIADPRRFTFDTSAADAAFGVMRRRGGVVCSLHAGNWELIALSVTRLGLPVAGVYQAIANPFLDEMVLKSRAPLYPSGLIAKGPAAARALTRHVRGGGVMAMLADHRDIRGLLVDFLGGPAWCARVPAFMARNLDVPLVVGRVIRRGPGSRFHMEAVELTYPRTDDRDADIDAATVALNQLFERWIKEHPTDYMWVHNRWLRPADTLPARPAVGPISQAAVAAHGPPLPASAPKGA